MRLHTWLTLGRASNLPSVWTNVFAAALVAQASLHHDGQPPHLSASLIDAILTWLIALTALSFMYLGGMFLNDAFDANWDKQHKQSRPIALGIVSAGLVWVHGIALLVAGVLLFGSHYASMPETQWPLMGWVAALLLVSAIVLYNALHKRIQHGAIFMGLCRLGVYLLAALMIAELTTALVGASVALFMYICGVTYAAKGEHQNQFKQVQSIALLFSPVLLLALHGYQHLYFWLYAVGFCAYLVVNVKQHLSPQKPNVGAFIGRLLAAVPLFDGMVLASMNLVIPSLLCFLVFCFMPRLQRWVAAT